MKKELRSGKDIEMEIVMRKCFALVLSVTLLLGFLGIGVQAAPADSGLKFKPDGAFKIIQVADLQEFMFSSKITRDFLYDLAQRERPDLFVLTGDNIHCRAADNLPRRIGRALIKSSIDGFMDIFDKIYDEFGTRVTMVYGNHDNEAAKAITKARQFEMYAAHRSFVGHYAAEADDGTGDEQGQHYGTHNLLIRDRAGQAPVFGLWMFDSGSYDPRGGCSCVQKPQIDWFKAANAATGNLPSLAFQHLPVADVYDFFTPAQEGDPDSVTADFVDGQGNPYTKTISKILPPGIKGELTWAPGGGYFNEGQLAALDEAGNVLAMFWGHNHNCTYEIQRPGKTDLVNSPCTGFGSYGDARRRGARIIVLDESDLSTYETYIVRYQGFYGDGWLRRKRVELFSKMNSWANIFDVIFFRPLLWLKGLFEK